MAKVYDVPAQTLVRELAAELKSEDVRVPAWAAFVKTGAHADKPPHDPDWWHTRCASLLRKLYMHGPVGVSWLRREYGGGKPRGYGARNHRDAGGAIIRGVIHEMERLGYVSKAEKRGRALTKEGFKKLDRISTSILGAMATKEPALKVYN